MRPLPPAVPPLAIVLIAAAGYLGALGGDFVFDDLIWRPAAADRGNLGIALGSRGMPEEAAREMMLGARLRGAQVAP